MSVTEAQIYAENHAGGSPSASSALLAAGVPVSAGQSSSVNLTIANSPVQMKSSETQSAGATAQNNSAGRDTQKETGAKEQTAPGMPLSKGKETVSSPALASRPVSALQANTAHSAPQKGIFPPFDTTYFASHILWLAVCFSFFYFFMARVVLPRIGGIIETRRDRIAADLDQAARMKTEADAAAEAYQKNLSEARNQAKIIAHMTAENTKTKAEAERKAFETGLEEKLAEAEEHVAACRNKALTEVNTIAGEVAADIVQKISGKKADKTALAQAIAAAGSAKGAAL